MSDHHEEPETWQLFYSEEGQPYYYNAATAESRWDDPRNDVVGATTSPTLDEYYNDSSPAGEVAAGEAVDESMGGVNETVNTEAAVNVSGNVESVEAWGEHHQEQEPQQEQQQQQEVSARRKR